MESCTRAEENRNGVAVEIAINKRRTTVKKGRILQSSFALRHHHNQHLLSPHTRLSSKYVVSQATSTKDLP